MEDPLSSTKEIPTKEHSICAHGAEIFGDKELSADEQVRFQIELWELLAKRTQLYTSGESSSIPELTAHRLMDSILFTIDIDPDDPSPSKVREILSEGMEKYFTRKLKSLENAIEISSEWWTEASLSTPLLESRALKDTLESIQQLKGVYDYRYFAQEIPADIDYPLAHPVSEYTLGINYINEYLKRLIVENHFMQNFDIALCRRLMRAIHPAYRSLLINLFEPIAINAIGLALAEQDIFLLNIDQEARVAIETKLKDRSKQKVTNELRRAAQYVCDLTRTKDKAARHYVEKTAQDLYPRITAAFKRGGLEGVFISFA